MTDQPLTSATLVLLLACNDHRNGCFTGWCDALHLLPSWRDEPLMELAGAPWRCREGQGGLWMGHEHLRVSHSKTWTASWCWNAYEVPLGDAARLLAALCASPRWDIEEGDPTLYNAWRSEEHRSGAWATLLQQTLTQEESRHG